MLRNRRIEHGGIDGCVEVAGAGRVVRTVEPGQSDGLGQGCGREAVPRRFDAGLRKGEGDADLIRTDPELAAHAYSNVTRQQKEAASRDGMAGAREDQGQGEQIEAGEKPHAGLSHGSGLRRVVTPDDLQVEAAAQHTRSAANDHDSGWSESGRIASYPLDGIPPPARQ